MTLYNVSASGLTLVDLLSSNWTSCLKWNSLHSKIICLNFFPFLRLISYYCLWVNHPWKTMVILKSFPERVVQWTPLPVASGWGLPPSPPDLKAQVLCCSVMLLYSPVMSSQLPFRASQVVKNPPVNAGNIRDPSSIPGSGRFPWRRKWQPTQVFLPGESPRKEEPGGAYSPWGRRVQTWLRRLCVHT